MNLEKVGIKQGDTWWPDLESNQGHKDFQSFALPTELSGHAAQLEGAIKR